MDYRYLDSFFPSMPVLVLRFGYPDEADNGSPAGNHRYRGRWLTGAPGSSRSDPGAPIVDSKRIRSHWGEWRQVLVFAVDIGIEDLRLPWIEVVGDDQGNEVILGRNILNRLRLLLDGPREELRIMS